MHYYTRALVDIALSYILLVTWLWDFQVRTNLLRKAYSYDDQCIDGVHLHTTGVEKTKWTWLTLEDLTANVSIILSLQLFAVFFLSFS